jgi:hypothetical protein
MDRQWKHHYRQLACFSLNTNFVMTVKISPMIQAATVARFEANYGTWSTPKDDTDDTRKDIHREHDSGVPPVLPDILFVHSDILAFEGRV